MKRHNDLARQRRGHRHPCHGQPAAEDARVASHLADAPGLCHQRATDQHLQPPPNYCPRGVVPYRALSCVGPSGKSSLSGQTGHVRLDGELYVLKLGLPGCSTSSLHMCAPVCPCSLHKSAASLLHRHQRARVSAVAEGEARNRTCPMRPGRARWRCANGRCRAPPRSSTSTCSSTGMRQRPTRISGELGAPGCRPRPRCRAGGAGPGRAGGAGRAPSTPGCSPGAGSGWRSRGGTRLWMSQALGRFGSHCSSAATVVRNRSLVMVCPMVWLQCPGRVAARCLQTL